MLRLIALIVVSLYAVVPSSAAPARLGLLNTVNSILIEAQARRPYKPSGDLQSKYREHRKTYDTNPTSTLKQASPPTSIKVDKVLVDDLGDPDKTGGSQKRACPDRGYLKDSCDYQNVRGSRRILIGPHVEQ